MADEQGQEQPAEQAAQSEQVVPATNPFEELVQRLEAIESRLTQVEGVAHTDHSIGSDVLDQLAGRVFDQVSQQLRQHLGLGGQPIRG